MSRPTRKRRRREPVTEERARREQAKRERRMERQRREADERRRRVKLRRVRNVAIALVVALVVGAGIFFLVRPDPELEGVERPANQGRRHLAAGERPDYGGDPAPTSGPHDARAPRCGVQPSPLDLPLAVHALEHGVVVLWYRPDHEDEALPSLAAVASRHDSHVIVSPNPQIDEVVVATAWNRRMRFDDPEDPVIAEFVETYRRRGPERVDCPM